jgi:hypothetical protein
MKVGLLFLGSYSEYLVGEKFVCHHSCEHEEAKLLVGDEHPAMTHMRVCALWHLSLCTPHTRVAAVEVHPPQLKEVFVYLSNSAEYNHTDRNLPGKVRPPVDKLCACATSMALVLRCVTCEVCVANTTFVFSRGAHTGVLKEK